MRTIGHLVRSSGRLLARRLQQLQSKLQILIHEVRATVARLVSETLGTAVRDAVEQAIDQVSDYLPQPSCYPSSYARPEWHDRPDRRDDRQETDPWFEEPDRRAPVQSEADPLVVSPVPGRLSIALTAGVHAANWWRRRWPGPGGLFTTVPVALFAGGAAYVVPALALLGLRLAGCAVQIQDLIDVLHPLGML
jgi:hypothetical protein